MKHHGGRIIGIALVLIQEISIPLLSNTEGKSKIETDAVKT